MVSHLGAEFQFIYPESMRQVREIGPSTCVMSVSSGHYGQLIKVMTMTAYDMG